MRSLLASLIALLPLSLVVVPALDARAVAQKSPSAASNAPVVTGGDTPQDVMARMEQAISRNDVVAATLLVTPDGRRELLTSGVQGLMLVARAADPDGFPPGVLPKAEVEKMRKDYRAVMEIARGALKPHGMEPLLGKPPMAPEAQKALADAMAKVDTVTFTPALFSAIKQIEPLVGGGGGADVPFKFGPVTGYKVSGDKATATSGKDRLDFVRLDGRWYLTPPAAGK